MLFFRIYTHLLPRATAWRLSFEKTLRDYWAGLAQGPTAIRDFFDATWLDVFPETTTSLAAWERQFGITAPSSDAARRLQLAAEWAAQGGQSPSYLEGVVRAAGFDVRLYEWWSSGGPPWVARNPHDYTQLPQVGTFQCNSEITNDTFAQCTDPTTEPPDALPPSVSHVWELYPMCNRFLVNDPGYLVNDSLTPNAPPAIPDDPSTWPYFVYWAGDTISTRAQIPIERRGEFERLLLKLVGSHLWIVTYVDYV